MTHIVMLALCFVLFLNSCGGGGSCSRNKGNENRTIPPNRDDVGDIYSHPVPFDEQAVAEAERLVVSGSILTSAEKAQIIVMTEAALNHLSQILEQLKRDEDASDTFHVLNDLNTKEWPAQCGHIIARLDNGNLDPYERERVDAMMHTADYIADIAEQLTDGNANMPRLNFSYNSITQP